MSAYYCNTLKAHQTTPADELVGIVSLAYSNEHLNQKQKQTQAWYDTVVIIKDLYSKLSLCNLPGLEGWSILYEYRIPRRSKRIDVVLLANDIVIVLEVKNNADRFIASDRIQLEDYCLDLRDFHEESKNRVVVPMLLCTKAVGVKSNLDWGDGLIKGTQFVNLDNLSFVMAHATAQFGGFNDNISADLWNNSSYFPTPSIIEAAQTLYAGQGVREILSNKAGVENLTQTTSAVIDAIRRAQDTNSKIICFVTGVPGAGKTLAGLNIIHNKDFQTKEEEIGVFLSGNSPLVKVLSEALARDFSVRETVAKSEAKRRVKTFIHNVHEFIDEYYTDKSKLPVDKVLVYDEAQRAWSKEHKEKKSNGLICASEPEILMSIMDRFSDWAVIIALVGSGQEINTGEGGLREWGKSIEEKFGSWTVYVSGELIYRSDIISPNILFEKDPINIDIVEDSHLQLNVSIRSYKAKELSQWVDSMLSGDAYGTKTIHDEYLGEYPIYITRDVENTKAWLRNKEKGSTRIGLIASSGGRRLRPLGYDPFYGLRGDSSQDELGAWYLNPPDDVRSSNFLEVIATEYAVQGLEIDWAGVLWDCDLRRVSNGWDYCQFKGTKWQKVSNSQRKQYIINKYRVLLTRARQGLVICVPLGNSLDSSRLPDFYNDTYTFLRECGIREI
jgi:hypothetical protein